MHALSIVFRALVGPGESVLVPTPGFFFGGPIEAAGARPVSVPAPQLELEALEAAIDRSTRALVLCNPVNPTGFLPDEGHVAALLELARRHDLLIVTDEAYDRYVYGGAAVASAFGPPEVVLVRSIGKSYALPSWRLGFVAGPAELVTKCHEVLEWEVLRVSHVAQRAATAAIEGPQDWLEELRAHYERNRDLAYAALRATPLACELPRATPFLFPDVTAIGGSRALLEAGIPCVDGAAFGAPGFARVAFGGAAAAIEGLVEALRLQQFGTS
jgi:aspartate/methionine/tyrosine aminotransferase